MEVYGEKFIDIKFDDSKSVFYSGQLLSGKINFELNSPLQIWAIDVIFLGVANVDWNEEQIETYGNVRRTKAIKHIGKEEYFNCLQRLTQEALILPAGRHAVPFSYQIPFTAPSSFKGEKGQVSYTVTVHVIREDGVTKETVVAEFEVISPLNLNTGSDDIKKPLVMEFEEMMTCQCFCASKPISLTVSLPAHGFCPGQTVPITVNARNKTSVEVNKIVFEITSRQRYHSQHPVSDYEPPEEVLVSVKKGPILSNTVRDYAFDIKIPDFIAPYMENCTIIDVGYFFKVEMKLSGCNEDLEDEAEICIGLVPLGCDFTSDVKLTHPLGDQLPDGPIPVPDSPAPDLPPAYQSTVTPNENILQICPPGPIPYPIAANVVDKPIYGSKNSLAGSTEIGFRIPDAGINSMSPNSVPPYPYPNLPQNQNPPYPLPNLPQNPNPPYPLPNLPRNQISPYPAEPSFGSQPSAPPPY